MQTKRYSSVEVEINLRADALRELFYCPLGPADELHRRHIWAKIRKISDSSHDRGLICRPGRSVQSLSYRAF